MKWKRVASLLAACTLAAAGVFSATLARAQTPVAAVEGEILVGMRPGSARAARLAQLLAGDGVVAGEQTAIRAFRVRGNGLRFQRMLSRLRRLAEVEYVEVNQVRRAAAIPSDPSWNSQYGPKKMQVDQAWDYYEPRGQVIVAVVDTGVDYDHPDLAPVLLRDSAGQVVGYNSLNGSTNARDDDGHGTHCAGIIAARVNNGVGIAGVAGWNPRIAGSNDFVRILPVKALDRNRIGTDSSVANGIIWAADRGAKVISLSLGAPGYSNTLNNAVTYAWNKGALVVAAAGNASTSTAYYPAACTNALSVAATDSSDTLATFSNWGSWVKVAAPGAVILSTYPGGGYANMSGTSMACPHVAGLAALLRSHSPTLSNNQVTALITTQVDPYTPYAGRSLAPGAGRVNARRALLAAGGGTISAPPAPTGLHASAGDRRVSLVWNTVGGASSYTVKRSTSSGTGYMVVASGLDYASYTDATVTNGTQYYYVVAAVNSVGSSPHSAQVAAIPQALSAPPVAPAGLQATAGDRKVTLSWNSVSGATSYRVKRSASSGGGYTVIGSGIGGTSYTDSGVTNGSTYYYVVTAVNSSGESGNSSQVAATPSAPASAPGSGGAAALRLNVGGGAYTGMSGAWSADSHFSGAAIYGYPARDIQGTADDALYLRVRYGQSFSYSLPVSPGSYTLRLSFAECWFTTSGERLFNVTVNGSPALTNFDIVQAAGGPNRLVVREIPATAVGGKINVVFQSMKNDALLNALEVVSSGGGSAAPAVPAVPTGLQATAGNGQVILTWTASTGASSYTVKRSTSSGSGYAVVRSGLTGTSFTDTAASNGTTYYYVVSAANSAGSSADSSPVSARPAAPTSGKTTLRINCGSSEYTSAGITWLSERYGSGGATITYSARDIQGTADDVLYRSVRYSNGTDFSYSLPAEAGSYTLRLHFAECWFTAPGGRIFNVKVNGTTVLANFDIVAAGGANTAVVRSIPVSAGANGVTVTFENVLNGPVISAIELIPAS